MRPFLLIAAVVAQELDFTGDSGTCTVTCSSPGAKIDLAALMDRVAFLESKVLASPPSAPPPPAVMPTLMWNFETGNSELITGVAATAETPRQGEFNLQGGNSEYNTYPGFSELNMGTFDFTFIWEMKTPNGECDTFFRRIFTTHGPSGNTAGNLQLTMDCGGTRCINAWTGGGLDTSCNTDLADNEWHTVGFRRSSNTLAFFVDGEREALTDSDTFTGPLGNFNGGAPQPAFGSYIKEANVGRYVGYLKKFSFYNEALSDELMAEFTASTA